MIPSVASADQEVSCYETQFDLPERSFFIVEEERYLAFDLSNSKLLLTQLSCGAFFKDKSVMLETQAELKDLAVAHYMEVNKLQVDKINFLQEDRDRVVAMWREENKKRHEAENGTSYGWVAASVLAITSITFGVAFVLK